MEFSKELKEEIEKCLSENHSELKQKIFSGDAEAIEQFGYISHQKINPSDIVEAYENNNIDFIYRYSKKLLKMQELYIRLCDEYSKKDEEKSNMMK